MAMTLNLLRRARLVPRYRFCGKEIVTSCRVATNDAVVAFARATAAKPHPAGGLAVLLADQ
jgi:hypothetical protein